MDFNYHPKVSEGLRGEKLGAALSQVLRELDLSDLQPLAESLDSAPVLLQDLQANALELSEICQVLADRSLNRNQYRALAALEVAILALEEKVQDFVSHF